jgi:hypothetical protein
MAEAEAAIESSIDDLHVQMGYRWHTSEGGNRVQLGVPDTDDYALRISCRNRRLLVDFPASTNDGEGSPTSALFHNGERRPGAVFWRDGRPFVVVPLATEDSLVAELVTERRISIRTSHSIATAWGEGGSRFVQSLADHCRTAN